MRAQQSKNIAILLTEIAVIFLMVLGIVPREASLFLTGLLVFYFIFSPIEDAVWVFIASIPLFIALPISEDFDSMANWRILLTVLFLSFFLKERTILKQLIDKFKFGRMKTRLAVHQIECLIGLFFFIGLLSLWRADNVWVGVKKMLFLINAFLLFIIIKNLLSQNKEILPRIISAIKVAIALTLGVGVIQLMMVFFVNLHQFWYLWDRNVINIFYGQALSNLLSYSNTWFSYSSFQLPTLRMFSVFPDSHSFALFCVLSLPLILVLIFNRKGKPVLFYLFLIINLLAIVFSGTRGAWASAGGTLIVLCFLLLFSYWPRLKEKFFTNLNGQWSKQISLTLGSLIIFFLLLPIGSAILFIPQYIQLGQEAEISNVSLFARASTIVDLSEASVRSRLEIWQKTIDSIILRPFLGVGMGNYPVVLGEKIDAVKRGASAHSLYLDIAAEMGIFALITLIAIFWYIFKDSWQVVLQSKEAFVKIWAGFFGLVFIWVLVYNLFDVVLLNDKVLLFFLTNLAIIYGAKSTIGLG